MLSKRILSILAMVLLVPTILLAQNTTSGMRGLVKIAGGQPLVGATVTVTHEPTGTVYKTQTRTGGTYVINNMNPGGPYTIVVTFVNYGTETLNEVYVGLGEVATIDVNLKEKGNDLGNVVVTTIQNKKGDFSGKGGAETTIGKEKLDNLPTVGRNLQDFLRFVPQAKISGSDGNLAGISFGGQNNRYNSFYIDGAANNDQFGLASSGTNGGQTGGAPISIDALDQIQVVLSPYDASIGNFTGAGINATTRSGTNKTQASVYTFYRNQDLTGKTPTGDKNAATRLANFTSQTSGFRVGGALIKNKLFYFLNAETVRDERPQPFIGTYSGNTAPGSANFNAMLARLASFGYDPGGYIDNKEELKVDRLAAKLDWNVNTNHRLSVSYRYNKSERVNVPTTSNTSINFYNGGYLFPNTTHSGSVELKSTFKKGQSNKLLLTFTSVTDDRGPLGNPFPRVTIQDGAGRFVFGTENFSTANLLTQRNFALLDFYKFTKGKHNFTIGTDNELTFANNVFIRDNYGTYTFPDVATFINNGFPNQYSRSFSVIDGITGDNTSAAAKVDFMRLAGFINDEIRVNNNLTVNVGVRLDYVRFMNQPVEDPFFNDTALGRIAQHYDLKGARSGQMAQPRASISPRIGFTYKIPEENLVIRGGAGLFTGRMPLAWPGGVYNNTGRSIGGIFLGSQAAAQAAGLRFVANPFGQPSAQDLGINVNNAKGQVDLISRDFRLPKIFRGSIAADKRIGNGWTLTAEAMVTANINEIYYENVNILPPTLKATGPDTRNVYSATGSAPFIPIRANGTNPYTGIYLLSNKASEKGFAYNFTFTVDKQAAKGWSFNANYAYGNSYVTYEGTSSQNNSQFNTLATVNGRNFATRARSDFDLGHRITAFVSKKFVYAKKSMATTISLFYTGQSGNPLTYVYNSSMVRDVSAANSQDLIYIPTANDIRNMVFVQSGTWTPDMQRAALETYIQGSPYLNKNRGQYAERNGDRLPFTHVLDLSFKQDFSVKIGKDRIAMQLTYDIFNFSNMLNREWGRQYFASFNTFQLMSFRGYQAGTTVPTYSFVPPANNAPYTVSTSTAPSFSARWVSQVGLRISFN